jgi:hypothetical protein
MENPWKTHGKAMEKLRQACVQTEVLHSEIAAERQNREAALRRPDGPGMESLDS